MCYNKVISNVAKCPVIMFFFLKIFRVFSRKRGRVWKKAEGNVKILTGLTNFNA